MGPEQHKQLQMMQDLGATVLTATSSMRAAAGGGRCASAACDKLHLRRGIFGSERWSEKLAQGVHPPDLGISFYDIYGLTECTAPASASNCRKSRAYTIGMIFIYIEIIDRHRPSVPDGETGEIVITTLVKEGAPLLRFRTRDFSRIIEKKMQLRGSCFPPP